MTLAETTDTSDTVAVRQDQPKSPVSLTGPIADLDSAYRYAVALAGSDFMPRDLRGKPSNVLAIILYGQQLSLTPMQAIQTINVINGRPSMNGQLWLAKVREAGHTVAFTDRTDTSCTATITRGDTGEQHTETFTIDDAVHAGLVALKDGKPYRRSNRDERLPWETYTSRMIMWRAVTHCATVACPEVALGFAPWDAPDDPIRVDVARIDEPTPPIDDAAIAAEIADLATQHAGTRP